jgi:oxalate decarboxylase/phosphoglucose isomerase-like protein (cupin superfamily)
MFLSITRTRKDLSEILYNPQANGSDPVYLVFSQITDGPWENITITSHGLLDKEYPKTYGHYHSHDSSPETFKVLFGNASFLLQEKYFEKSGPNTGVWIKNKVKRVITVKVEKDEIITVMPNWAHSCSNLGSGPLVTLDDWKGGHTSLDYQVIKEQKGFAYYLIEENGKFSFVKNPNYVDLPRPLVMTAIEFAKYQKENI